MNQRLYLASTNYTIVNSVILEKSFEDNYLSTIFIFNDKPHSLDINLRKIIDTTFSNVCFLPFINTWPRLRLIWIFLFPKIFFDSHSIKFQHAKCTLYSQSILYLSLFNRIINPEEMNLLEDGLSSYTNLNIDSKFRSSFFYCFDLLFFQGNFLSKIMGIYLHQPKIYKGAIPVKLFPDKGLQYFKKLNFVKHSLHEEFNNRLNIYLGTPLNTAHKLLATMPSNLNSFQDQIVSLINELLKAVDSSNLIYRMHPRERTPLAKDNIYIDSTSDPWEFISSKITDKHTLVSIFSTAALQPKIIYNTEPRIIFLFKLLDGYEFHGANNVVENLRQIYSKDLIFTPKSINELHELLNQIPKINESI